MCTSVGKGCPVGIKIAHPECDSFAYVDSLESVIIKILKVLRECNN